MKTFEITKEQILEVASWGNSQDLIKIKEWFPQAFEAELEVGKWYKSNLIDSLYFLKEKTKDGFNTYGFAFGEWNSKKEITNRLDALELATDKEVETALIEEAKRRGFKNGNYKCLLLPDSTNKTNEKYDYREFENSLALGTDSSNIVFDNGKWAEIINEPLTLEQRVEQLERQILCK